jgi:hypothetical protein
MGQNDGGVKRGDRADTGDLTAGPTEGAHGAGTGPAKVTDSEFGNEDAFPIGGLSDLTVKEGGDPTLGMTNVGEIGPDDWAADSGPTRSAEAEMNVATRELQDAGSTLVSDKHVREHSPDEGTFNLKPKKGAAKATRKKKTG